MIILNIELDNIYGFSDFRMNLSYPKKIVNSTIEEEYLKECPNFRFRKAVILMGGNATGKTTLGRALLRVFRFIDTGDLSFIIQMIGNRDEPARISIDFVNAGNMLNRIIITISPSDNTNKSMKSHIEVQQSLIGSRDTYERASEKLTPVIPDEGVVLSEFFRAAFGPIDHYFSLLNESNSYHDTSEINQELFLNVLKSVIATLDPTLTDISILRDVEDCYVIRRNGQEIILQKGRISDESLLSSGTVKGVDIAILIARILTGRNGFYYCDEHFSCIQTDLEKRLFGIMLEHLGENGQLIFTTHNSDMLDLNLPKHTYAFLKKEKENNRYRISILYASDILKRNTDSVRSAVANDVFASIPDDSLLNVLDSL